MSSFDISVLKTITVLYVEDEAGLREQELKAYNKLFKKVFPCKDGQDAWEQFQIHKNDIDIVVTDINMPVLSGLELLKKVIKISKVPTILTTAYQDSEYLLEAIELGVKKYITKPINIKNVVEDIQNVVEQTRKENKINEIAHSLLQESKHTEKHISDLTVEIRELKQNLVLKNNIIHQYIPKLTTNKNGNMLNISYRLLEILKYDEYELLTKNISMIQDQSCTNGSFQKQMLNVIHKKASQTSSFLIKTKENNILEFIINISSIFDENGLVKEYEYYFSPKC